MFLEAALLMLVPYTNSCIACACPPEAGNVLLITVANCTQYPIAHFNENTAGSCWAGGNMVVGEHPICAQTAGVCSNPISSQCECKFKHWTPDLCCCLPANVCNGALMILLLLGPIPFIAVSMPHDDQSPACRCLQSIAGFAEHHAHERRPQGRVELHEIGLVHYT